MRVPDAVAGHIVTTWIGAARFRDNANPSLNCPFSLGIRGGNRENYATFWTLPSRMHDVQTRIRRPAPFTRARTDCRFTFQRRFVTLWAWLIRLPN
jgi:hypothetical protein